MKVKTYLDEALEDIVYENLGEWCIPNLHKYSLEKNLFNYQIDAVKNAIKVLHEFYKDEDKGKDSLYSLCAGQGLKSHSFDIKEYIEKKENIQYSRYSSVFNVSKYNDENIISEKNFFNRMCFWMATASGKTIVLIKIIEILDYLIKNNLIPKKEFMVLLPNEKIQNQFYNAVKEYNVGKERKINLVSLKKFEKIKNSFINELYNDITVFIYRSDLLSDQEKSKKVDTITYDNNGEWYIFMDEAHKGDKEDSLRQTYITIMSRNGFLFNFSATFTDYIDFATTCYNFNLEKFIEAKYGKNIYLSESKYQFKKKSDDFSEKDKQLQVLKSLITFTLVKKAKKQGYYHHPLMVTLVNEVNTKDSDIDLFFNELAKIATGKVEKKLIDEAKKELYEEFVKNKKFQFGNESLFLDDGKIKSSLNEISLSEILINVYNSKTHGQIQVIEGEKGKEFALRLATADEAFALFRIGDASSYIKNKLAGDYLIIDSYEEKHYFDNLNSEDGAKFNILIGSRMFYEGWDSNRPNVMNFINIGTTDAQKFVLQSLGRGVRIEPTVNNRQRLKTNDSNKEQLLETLFVFATNRKAVETILETMNTQKNEEKIIQLKQNSKPFDLLIPYYSEKDKVKEVSKFNISKESFERLKKYVDSFTDNLLLILTNIQNEDIKVLRNALDNKNILFRFNNSCDYKDMNILLNKLIAHLSVNDKYVAGIKELDDEIIHFKHIKIRKDKWEILHNDIQSFIDSSSINEPIDIKELATKFVTGQISKKEFDDLYKNAVPQNVKEIGDLKLIKLSKHYYLPLILSTTEKLDYMKHIIDVKSEVNFIENLLDYLENKNDSFNCDWMFSKIDQTIDSHSIAMPYFSYKDNMFHEFYPDFIFWIKKDNSYKIVFLDPKGTAYTAYEQKVDWFEQLFLESNGEPKIFTYKNYKISFDLKLATESDNEIGAKYKKYWLSNDDFSWLK